MVIHWYDGAGSLEKDLLRADHVGVIHENGPIVNL